MKTMFLFDMRESVPEEYETELIGVNDFPGTVRDLLSKSGRCAQHAKRVGPVVDITDVTSKSGDFDSTGSYISINFFLLISY